MAETKGTGFETMAAPFFWGGTKAVANRGQFFRHFGQGKLLNWGPVFRATTAGSWSPAFQICVPVF